MRRQTQLSLALYLVFSLGLIGCRFDAGQAPASCESDDDCASGLVCKSNTCLPGGTTSDAGEDVSLDLSTDAPTNNQPCGPDEDDDGFGVGPDCPTPDCNDSDGNVYPGAPIRCNGEDNDCDGEPDTGDCECVNGATEVCGSDIGECEKGMRTCENGTWSDCQDEVGPSQEACDGLDNNCDGTEDEGCPCTTGESQTCGTDVGLCATGNQLCVMGAWSTCQGGQGPTPEICDGQDNDCNGVDDDVAGLGDICVTGRPGICASGQTACVAGMVQCQSINPSEPESCNNMDDDCDGTIDNDVTQACNTACGVGTETCNAGVFENCMPDNPPEEICDGDDNDCDGQTDESFPEMNDPCPTGMPGICAQGTYDCRNTILVCAPDNMPIAETCNGDDDDCDGLTDEDPNDLVLKRPLGFCPNGGVELCLNGVYSGVAQNDIEICDGADRSCDQLSDNSSACYRVCGNEIIQGTQVCGAMSNEICTLPSEICADGIDNDCDGMVDLNCDTSVDNMVFVPGGTFIMGSDPVADPDAAADEQPQHTVALNPYYIDKYEVTRAQYTACVIAGQCSLLTAGCPAQITQTGKPIVCTTHAQADTYCKWRNKRLPTEAEWEKAARGPYARTPLWPYGDVANNGNGQYNCNGSANQCSVDVTSFQAGESYYGARNMSGNAGEIVEDFYDANFYIAGIASNPLNDVDSGNGHVVRGGTYSQDFEFGRTANRAVWSLPSDEVGFRCAKDF